MQATAEIHPPSSHWQDLPALPQPLAGQCVGNVGDLLVVAGGSTWTKPPWDGGIKRWSSDILALAPGATTWQTMGHLPRPAAYGAAAQVGHDMVCIGGQDADHVYDSALRLTLVGRRLQVTTLPDLPRPLTNAAAAAIGDTVFVVGGQQTLDAQMVSNDVWQIDVSEPSPSWQKAPAPPWKHARILPIAASCSGDLYVASGADVVADVKGALRRIYLRDAWRLKPHHAWTRLPDLPVPVTGAPSICDAGRGALLIFGGDDGSLAPQIFTLKNKHPGFSLKTYRFHDGAWTEDHVAALPVSLVTTGAVQWGGQYVIAGGENRPGHRSGRVIGLDLRASGPNAHTTVHKP